MSAVLGIDLASASWTANGSALVAWADGARASRAGGLPRSRADGRAARVVTAPEALAVTRVHAGIVPWPTGEPLTPLALADAVDACARQHRVRAVAIDGPHAWRDPARGADGPGVGRWSEYLVRAQGKTGVHGHAYPKTQLAWTTFSIAVFEALLARPGVRLAEPAALSSAVGSSAVPVPRSPGAEHSAARDAGDASGAVRAPAASRSPHGYQVLETYPTATWRAAGLAPLPAKARRPDVAAWYARLAETFELPREAVVRGHDDLQAVVAALAGVGVAGGPVRAAWHGHPCRTADGVRVEGGIWVAAKL